MAFFESCKPFTGNKSREGEKSADESAGRELSMSCLAGEEGVGMSRCVRHIVGDEAGV